MIFKKLLSNPTAKTLIANFSYLSVIEIVGLLLPLVSYPYLIRVVGADYYGVVIFAQAIVAYLIIIINFGFNVSATRRVSENRNDINMLRKLYSSITYQKTAIFLLSIILLIPILYFLRYGYSVIVLGLMGLCIQEILFPTWIFQGLEKMKFITIITFLSKCSYLLLIFVFIHKPSDYIYIPLLYSFGGILTSVVSLFLLKYQFNLYFVRVTKSRIKEDFKESMPFFASRLSSVVMERTNVIVIGSFFSYEMVAIYDLCTKVVSILKTPYSLMVQVLYPNVAKTKNMGVVKKIVKPLLCSGLIIVILIIIFAPLIINLLGGDKMIESIPILRLMVVYVPIVAISYLFGASVLVVKGYSKHYNLSVIYSVLLYLLIILFLVMAKAVNLYTMTLAFIVPELFVALYRTLVIKNKKLLV